MPQSTLQGQPQGKSLVPAPLALVPVPRLWQQGSCACAFCLPGVVLAMQQCLTPIQLDAQGLQALHRLAVARSDCNAGQVWKNIGYVPGCGSQQCKVVSMFLHVVHSTRAPCGCLLLKDLVSSGKCKQEPTEWDMLALGCVPYKHASIPGPRQQRSKPLPAGGLLMPPTVTAQNRHKFQQGALVQWQHGSPFEDTTWP